MAVTQEEVIDYIKKMSVLEVSELVKKLEDELGVKAAAAVPMGVVGAAGAAPGAARGAPVVSFASAFRSPEWA